MYRSILFAAVFMLLCTLLSAQGRLQIQADFGVSFPVGTFGKTDNTAMRPGVFGVEVENRGFDKSKAGFATTGYKTGLNVGYMIFNRLTLLANYQITQNGTDEGALSETVQNLWVGDFRERVTHDNYETSALLFGARYEIPVTQSGSLSLHFMAGNSTLGYPGYTVSYPDFSFTYTQREEFVNGEKYDDPTSTMIQFGVSFKMPLTEKLYAGLNAEYASADYDYEMINGSAPGGSDFFYFEDTVVYRAINFGFVFGVSLF